MATKVGQEAQATSLRSIAAREHRRIRAERRAADEERKRARQETTPSVSWSAKPEPRRGGRRRKGAAVELDKRGTENRLAWARRHPKLAAEERELRKGRVDLLKRWDRREDGTAETLEHAARANARRHQGPLAQLYRNGEIDSEQLAAAVEIAEVAERIARDVTVKTASLETRIDVTRHGDGSFFERLGHVRREMAYTRWRGEAEGPIGAVLDMIIGEPEGFTIVARRYRIHNRKAKRLLVDALSLWPKILGEICREVDHKDLVRAQARIL